MAETAKTLSRTANPDRERLPPHFEESVRLSLRRIEDGRHSAQIHQWQNEREGFLKAQQKDAGDREMLRISNA